MEKTKKIINILAWLAIPLMTIPYFYLQSSYSTLFNTLLWFPLVGVIIILTHSLIKKDYQASLILVILTISLIINIMFNHSHSDFENAPPLAPAVPILQHNESTQ